MSLRVVVTGAFDDLRPPDVRLLHEASLLGALHVRLWSDELAEMMTGRRPAFGLEERLYLLGAMRYVASVGVAASPLAQADVPRAGDGTVPDAWVEREGAEMPGSREACEALRVRHALVGPGRIAAIPGPGRAPSGTLPRPIVVVTGCFDWLHSGHIRFFEEVSALGTLVVVVGSDRNVRALKGEGHPLLDEEARRYMVQSVRFVAQALASTGRGWLDAAPEIELLRPDTYAVNEDGDVPEKRAFCDARGIRYEVLKRVPREGLPKRSSTDLRGY